MDASGTWDDAAVTNPAARASMVALLKGLLQQGLSGSLVDGAGNVLTVKSAVANITASQTDSSVITGVPAKKLRVLALSTQDGGTATTIVFSTKPAGASTPISPTYAQAVNAGVTLPFNPQGWFQTAAGDALVVTTGAGSTTGILVTYVEVP